MKLTKLQLLILKQMVSAHIDWNEVGCFGDGSEIVDKKGYNSAKKILEKIQDEQTIFKFSNTSN